MELEREVVEGNNFWPVGALNMLGLPHCHKDMSRTEPITLMVWIPMNESKYNTKYLLRWSTVIACSIVLCSKN